MTVASGQTAPKETARAAGTALAQELRLPSETGPGIIDRRPLMREMLDLRSFTDVCKSFVDLYRVGLKVFDDDGAKLVDIKTGSGDFCAYMFTKGQGRVLCTETVTYVKQHPLPVVTNAIESRDCFSGCRYVMTPIVHEGDALGRIVFGPFVPEDLADLGDSLASMEEVFDLSQSRELMSRIRRVPEATVRKVLDHFSKVVDVLVFTSYRSHLTSQLHVESITMSYRDLVEKNRQLEDSYAQLKELDRLKSNFLATMSHELRTPLTSVIGYSEMLLSGLAGQLLPEQREYLATILEKGESLLSLISAILDLSKIEAKGVMLSLRPTDIPQLMKSSATTLLPTALKKKIKLTWESETFDPRPMLDEDRVRQCVVNLLQNAVKFTPEGGSVHLSARVAPSDPNDVSSDEMLEISVRDTGMGIAPEQHERIFQTFYQVDGSSTREHGGTGLGLAIVRSFVEGHGGYVQLRSALGEGSEFTLVFPLRYPEPPSRPPAVVETSS